LAHHAAIKNSANTETRGEMKCRNQNGSDAEMSQKSANAETVAEMSGRKKSANTKNGTDVVCKKSEPGAVATG